MNKLLEAVARRVQQEQAIDPKCPDGCGECNREIAIILAALAPLEAVLGASAVTYDKSVTVAYRAVCKELGVT